jgi:transposase
MPAPYSQDLRTRVASAISGGSSPRKAADRFGIGISTAIRWAQRLQAEGHVEARAMGGDQRSRLREHREVVLALLAHQPDLTLEEIRSALIERHAITVGRGTVWRFLKAHNITLKKKVCTPPSSSVLTRLVVPSSGASPPLTRSAWYSSTRHRQP